MSTSANRGNPGPAGAPDDVEGTPTAQEKDQRKAGEGDPMANTVCGDKDNHTSVSSGNRDAQVRLSQRAGGDNAASLDQDVQAAIGRQLRAMFDEIVQAPVPDRFNELLSKLEERPKGR